MEQARGAGRWLATRPSLRYYKGCAPTGRTGGAARGAPAGPRVAPGGGRKVQNKIDDVRE
ncbi:hypothetical protein JCM13210_18250 [Thermaerobacter litoralis]